MKISVVIPTYNHAHWLPQSIESALHQTLEPHEVIVVDDGSTDNTKEIVSRYPVKYIYHDNSGLSATRNRGIQEANCDWIALLDADDYWLPQKLELQAAAIANEGFCYCATTRFFPDGHTEEAEFIDAPRAVTILRHHNFIDPSAVLARKELFLQVGGFNTNMPAGEDWEMWLKLSRVCDFVGIPDRLLMYRVAGTGMSANPELFLRSMEDIIVAGTSDLPPVQRFIEARRMRCVRLVQVGIKYRDKGDYYNARRCAWKAFKSWPSPFYDRSFKFLVLELRRLTFPPKNRP